jgi:beta-lactamase class C
MPEYRANPLVAITIAVVLVAGLPLAATLMASTQATTAAAETSPAEPVATIAPRPRKPGSIQRSLVAEASQMETLASRLVSEKNLPGLAMAIVHNGEVISLKGYGLADAKGGQAVDADTVFRMASLSKGFAGTVSAQLVAEGAMDWDALVAGQLPEFKLRDVQGAQKVTVRDLLAHRVGLTRNTYDRDLEGNTPYPLLAERLSNAPMTCAPGECYSYQNIAFSLIGDVVFAVTGDFYAHQVEKRIFHPLGMASATFGRDELMASPRWARPHVRAGKGWRAVTPKENYYHLPPAAGVNASIRDMSHWLNAQLGHRPDVLPLDLLNQIHTPQITSPTELRGSPWRRERLRGAWYGLGWRIFDYQGHTLVFHGGAVQGYRGLIGFLPEQDTGIVVLWNSESAAPSGLLPAWLDRALALPERNWLGIAEDESGQD